MAARDPALKPDAAEARHAVTVYAGSRRSAPAPLLALAAELGRGIAARGWVLVYGGADVGLMGACANAALADGGRVEGVILDTFARVAHHGLHRLDVVGDMRSRKAGLAHAGDAFVALPGGVGTLEEVSEILVERQLGLHTKPLVLLDPDDFWAPLCGQLARMVERGLLDRAHLATMVRADSVASALDALGPEASRSIVPVSSDKW